MAERITLIYITEYQLIWLHRFNILKFSENKIRL